MATHVLCVLLFSIIFQTVCGSAQYRNDGLKDHINSGMKFAQNLLGSESVALKVAEFVVRAFQTVNKPIPNRRWPQNDLNSAETSSYNDNDSNTKDKDKGPADYDVKETQNPLTPLRQIVRLFGLQPSQISAVAVNALVFVAQMISTFLAGRTRPAKPYRSEDPTSWILNKNSRNLQNIIAAAKNESLPNTIDELIQEQSSEEETSCIRLLVCKVTPFISRMQKTVFGDESNKDDERFSKNLHGSAIMYRHLPTAEEINARSDICEKQYRDCNLNE